MFVCLNAGKLVPGTSLPWGTLAAPPKMTLSVLLLLNCLFGLLSAQSPQWVTSTQHEFAIDSNADLLMEGDTFDLVVRLGSATEPASDVLGADFWCDLQKAVPVSTPVSIDLDQSWLFAVEDAEQSTWLTGRLSTKLVRSDSSGQEGNGEVYRFSLVCIEDSMPASSVILDGGGMVMVDNVDLKRNPNNVENLLSAYPNPAHESIHVRPLPKEQQKFMLLDSWGRLVRGNIDLVALNGQVDLSRVPPGAYFLVGTNPEGEPLTIRIMKE